MNGVLPEPWLPLKKGQTLINTSRNGTRNAQDRQAVVLTLRRRLSGLRRGVRHVMNEGYSLSQNRSVTAVVAGNSSTLPRETLDPWGESFVSAEEGALEPRGARSKGNTPHNRLSFDPASGVIILPDSGDWLFDDTEPSSDEEDYDQGNAGLEHSVAESVFNEDINPSDGDGSTPLVSTSPTAPLRTSRYGTYYHHPERRKHQVPGAFPER